MSNNSIFNSVLQELQTNKNHDQSIERCKVIIKEIEELLNSKVISYFSSEVGADANSMIGDEDAFLIENLLTIDSDKKNVVLILHSNGGYAISAERIIDVCRNYCLRRGDDSKFIVIIPKRAKSAATIVALGADNIYLRDSSELGPVDPQFMISDGNGNINIEPAYVYVDAIENLFNSNKFGISKSKEKPLSTLPMEVKIKILEQCNYPMYVTSKKELGLSDSIIEKIANEKSKQNKKIKDSDFDIFKDPHITRSHGRLINIFDLNDNNLYKHGVINKIDKLFTEDENDEKLNKFDSLIWELYVRKRQLVNDLGNNIVKTIEDVNEFFINMGMKKGQIKKSPKKEDIEKKNGQNGPNSLLM